MFQGHYSLDQRDQTRGAFGVADVRLHRGDVNTLVSEHVSHCSGFNGISNCCASTVAFEVCRLRKVLGSCQLLSSLKRLNLVLAVIPACS